VFIGLDGGIDGLVHLSDLSWDKAGEEAVRDFQKGQDLETVILAIDPERERISLGVKQLTINGFAQYCEAHPKSTIVKGVLTVIEEKIALVDLGDEVEGVIKAADVSQDRVNDVRDVLRSGEEVEARIIGLDRKTNKVTLSIKAKEHYEQQEAMDDLKQSSALSTTLGDLFKQKMDNVD
jgi:small subunit ribosomal protein S1